MASEEIEFRRKNFWVLLLILAIFLYVVFLWSVDISVSGIITENNLNRMLGSSVGEFYLTNGFWNMNIVQMYHIGLIGSLLLFISMSIWLYMTRMSNDFLRRRVETLEKVNAKRAVKHV